MKKGIFWAALPLLWLLSQAGLAAFSPPGLTGAEDYSDVAFLVEQAGQGGGRIRADTTGQPAGYYTSFVFAPSSADLSGYGGLWFTADNRGGAVSVSLCLEARDGRRASVRTNTGYLVETGGERCAWVTDTDGILLPEASSTRIYLPFSALDAALPLTEIGRYGFYLTLPENSRCDLLLEQTEWLPAPAAADLLARFAAKIVGESALQIAVQGESVCRLSVAGPPGSSYRFLPLEDTPGLTLTPDGLLTCTAEADEGVVTVTARDEAGLLLAHRVELYRSWRLSPAASPANRFPTAQEHPLPNISFVRWFSGANLARLRIAGASGALAALASYLVFRTVARKKERER